MQTHALHWGSQLGSPGRRKKNKKKTINFLHNTKCAALTKLMTYNFGKFTKVRYYWIVRKLSANNATAF